MSGLSITLGLILFLSVLQQCNAQCTALPRRDCFSPGTSTNQAACQSLGCAWCPVTSGPWCIDACQTSTAAAIDCFVSGSTISQAQCTAKNCKWCPSLSAGVPACQTNHRDCLVNGRVDIKPPGFVATRNSCTRTAPIGLYCPLSPGVSGPICITPQPALANCFISGRTSTGPTTLYACHLSGGVFCDSTTFNSGTCIALPNTASATCPTTQRYQCIVNGVTSPTQTQCLENGCKWCPLTGQPSCIYGSSPQCVRTTRENCAATTTVTEAQCTALGCDFCPMSKSYHSNCALTTRTPCAGINQATVTQQTCSASGCIYCGDASTTPKCIANPNAACTSCSCTTKTDCLTEMLSNEANCLAKNCRWCPQSNTNIPNCIVFNIADTFHPNCALTTRTPCAGVNQTTVTELTCFGSGCIYCGDGSTTPKCIANPNATCTSCSCTTKTDCFSGMPSNESSCLAKNCRWCPQSNTNIPNCIVFNSGVSMKGQLTPCTLPCGGGTQWQILTTCTLPLLQCPRSYQPCNQQACPAASCQGISLLRYMSNSTRCCLPATADPCGIQLNSNPPLGRRRKRVVGGADVSATERWNWMGFIRPTAATVCGVVLIKVTAASSVGLSDANCTAGISVGTTVATFNQLTLSVAVPANVIATRVVVGDVAVLTFNTALPSGPAPICMPNGEDVNATSNCFILGWGARSAGGTVSDILIEARMQILPFVICTAAYPAVSLSETDMICAGNLGTSPDGCTGDEGGPLMCQRCTSCTWYVAGIVTPSVGCGTANKPTVFTRISALQTMIAAVAGVSPLPETATFSCP